MQNGHNWLKYQFQLDLAKLRQPTYIGVISANGKTFCVYLHNKGPSKLTISKSEMDSELLWSFVVAFYCRDYRAYIACYLPLCKLSSKNDSGGVKRMRIK